MKEKICYCGCKINKVNNNKSILFKCNNDEDFTKIMKIIKNKTPYGKNISIQEEMSKEEEEMMNPEWWQGENKW